MVCLVRYNKITKRPDKYFAERTVKFIVTVPARLRNYVAAAQA